MEAFPDFSMCNKILFGIQIQLIVSGSGVAILNALLPVVEERGPDTQSSLRNQSMAESHVLHLFDKIHQKALIAVLIHVQVCNFCAVVLLIHHLRIL